MPVCYPDRLGRCVAAAFIALSGSYCWADVAVPQAGSIEVTLRELATGFDAAPEQIAPTKLVPFPDGSGRFLVGTLGGSIALLNPDGTQSSYLTADQTGNVLQPQHGLTSIAFHSDFATPDTQGFGKFYTITSEDNLATAEADLAVSDFGTPDASYHDQDGDGNTFEHHDVVLEWNVTDSSALTYVGSAPREVLRVAQPGNFHNLTDLAFDSNGYLYISSGDGGGGPITAPDFGDAAGTRRDRTVAQDLGSIHGKVLRIDPLDPSPHTDDALAARGLSRSQNGSYAVPLANPFQDADGALGEIFAYGFRSPYRMTIDAATGEVWLGDVGNGGREEVNRVVLGGNYGWSACEGTADFDADCSAAAELTPPVIEYDHVANGGEAGRTVTGGVVYRGTALPELVGKYVFADFFTAQFDALYYGDIDTGEIFRFAISAESDRFDSQGVYPNFTFAIGEGLDGELYLVSGPGAGFGSADSGYVIEILPSLESTLAGDFNSDGVVDAADYTTWRDGLGSTYSVANHRVWRDSFGATATATVFRTPEPGSGIVALQCVWIAASRKMRALRDL